MERHGFLGLIQIVIQRSKEVAGGRFGAAAASDMRAAFALPILGRAPGEKQIRLKKRGGDTENEGMGVPSKLYPTFGSI